MWGLLVAGLLALSCGGSSSSSPSPTASNACTPSALYGTQGERWTASGRLLDYAFAGYRTGTEALPTPTGPAVSVTDFGARPDDSGDDTAAFLSALDAGSAVVTVPAGRFILTERLVIRRSGVVLRGAGAERTTIFCPRSLADAYGITFNSAGQSSWSFSNGFIEVQGSVGGGLLARVTGAVERGAKVLPVSTATGLAAGQWIRVLQTDAAGTLLAAFHAGMYPGDVGEDVGRQAFRFFSRIESVGAGTITLERPVPMEIDPRWTPEVRAVAPSVQEVGIEGLTVEFPVTRYPGHFLERGYNAIYLNGVIHSWVRDVRVLNSDYGINVNGSSFVTVQDVVIDDTGDRGPLVGHHALTSAGGSDDLFTRFDVRQKFVHDLSIDSYTTGTVWADGKGIDLNLDHHGRGNYGTLWTKLDLGAGTRAFASGGSAPLRMPHSGARTALWNVTAARDLSLPPADFGPLMTFVGVRGLSSVGAMPSDWQVEAIPTASLCQADLHAAMLARRR